MFTFTIVCTVILSACAGWSLVANRRQVARIVMLTQQRDHMADLFLARCYANSEEAGEEARHDIAAVVSGLAAHLKLEAADPEFDIVTAITESLNDFRLREAAPAVVDVEQQISDVRDLADRQEAIVERLEGLTEPVQ